MRRSAIALAAAAVLVGMCNAASAELIMELTAPQGAVKPGRMVRLSLAGNAEKVVFEVSGVDESDWLAVPQEDGTRALIVVCPDAGQYRVSAIGVRADITTDGKPFAEVRVVRAVIDCRKDGPGPKPDPKPPPGPGPVDPPPDDPDRDEAEFQAYVSKLVAGLPGNAKSQAEAAAAVYDRGAQEIADGDVTSIAILSGNTWRRLYAVTDRTGWKPFDEGIRAELERLATAGMITTIEHHEVAWRRIAAGIRDGAGATRSRSR